jgi:hypothetical protein
MSPHAIAATWETLTDVRALPLWFSFGPAIADGD